MPELTEDDAALAVDGLHHLLPGLDLLPRVDPRTVREPDRRRNQEPISGNNHIDRWIDQGEVGRNRLPAGGGGDEGALGDEEPAGGGALPVVLDIAGLRDAVKRSAPGHRRHDHPATHRRTD